MMGFDGRERYDGGPPSSCSSSFSVTPAPTPLSVSASARLVAPLPSPANELATAPSSYSSAAVSAALATTLLQTEWKQPPTSPSPSPPRPRRHPPNRTHSLNEQSQPSYQAHLDDSEEAARGAAHRLALMEHSTSDESSTSGGANSPLHPPVWTASLLLADAHRQHPQQQRPPAHSVAGLRLAKDNLPSPPASKFRDVSQPLARSSASDGGGAADSSSRPQSLNEPEGVDFLIQQLLAVQAADAAFEEAAAVAAARTSKSLDFSSSVSPCLQRRRRPTQYASVSTSVGASKASAALGLAGDDGGANSGSSSNGMAAVAAELGVRVPRALAHKVLMAHSPGTYVLRRQGALADSGLTLAVRGLTTVRHYIVQDNGQGADYCLLSLARDCPHFCSVDVSLGEDG